MIDLKKRTLLKMLSWKFVGFLVLSSLTYVITNNILAVSLIAFGYHTIQLFAFYIHERIWNRITWGKSKGLVVQLTGLSGAGKSTLSKEVAFNLLKKGYAVEIIDGDEYRKTLCSDLGFSKKDRQENIKRLSFVAERMAKNGIIVFLAAINPYRDIRNEIRSKSKVKTVYLNADIDTLIDRDVKGLYKRAMLDPEDSNFIPNFTGISDPYEHPSLEELDLEIDTAKQTQKKSVSILQKFIEKNL